MPYVILEHTYTKKLFVLHLNFKFNWVLCILPGKPHLGVGRPARKLTLPQFILPLISPGHCRQEDALS